MRRDSENNISKKHPLGVLYLYPPKLLRVYRTIKSKQAYSFSIKELGLGKRDYPYLKVLAKLNLIEQKTKKADGLRWGIKNEI